MIAIFGGSFNPVHIGHIIAAQQVLDSKLCKTIVFVPCNEHAFNKSNLVEGEHRYIMLKIATKSNTNMRVSDYEIKKGGVSYSYDTLQYFKQKHKKKKIAWIIGEDNLKDLPKWKNYSQFIQEATIIVVPLHSKKHSPKEEIKELAGNNALILDSEIKTNISSSYIREKIKLKKNPSYYLPPRVINYIKKNRLYN